MDNFKDLQNKIRDILDRNGFVNQKIDLATFKQLNKNAKIQDAFRIRVMQPLRFSVEIVKPIPLKDFIFIAGRLNIAPDHLKIINNLQLNQKIDLFDEIKYELTKRASNFKFAEDPGTKQVGGIECMMPIYIPDSDSILAKEIFAGMDEVNKTFFLVIFILQSFFRKSGFDGSISEQSSASSMYQ